jgi:hypothetical protein
LKQAIAAKHHSCGNIPACPDIAAYRSHHPAPGQERPNLAARKRDEIGNHFQFEGARFRIVNHSFTPA